LKYGEPVAGVLATLSLATAAVQAVHHAGDSLQLARTAVEKLIANARESLEAE